MISEADIVLENENIIYSIINKFGYYCDKEDLYQVAVIGLLNANKNYKSNLNTKFSSYAYFFILGEVKKYVREILGVKVSRDLQKLNLTIEKATLKLAQNLMRMPTDLEIIKFLNISEEQLFRGREAKILIDSLDKEELEDSTLYNKCGYEEKGYQSDILDLKSEIEKLSDFDRRLINGRYYEDKSQMEVSADLGISQVQVSRYEKNILMRLKEKL